MSSNPSPGTPNNLPPSAEEPERSTVPTTIEIGTRTRLFLPVLLVGLAMLVMNCGLLFFVTHDKDLFQVWNLIATMAIVFGWVPLLIKPVLVYAPGAATVTVKRRFNRDMVFPHGRHIRLEYSIYTGILYQVNRNGRRRRVAVGVFMEQTAWKAFVDRYLQDHSITEDAAGQ